MNFDTLFKKYKIEIVLFIIVLIFIVSYNLFKYNELYSVSDDGDLYISIAQNFLKSSHFIQNSRPHEINMVVPPGLPAILALLYFIGNSTSFVIFFQYLLFAFSAILLYKATANFCQSKIAGIICFIIYCLSDTILNSTVSPRYILTEQYTQLTFISILYILTIKKYNFMKKTKILMPVLLVGSLIRPVLFSILIFNIFVHVFLLIRYKYSINFLLNFIIISLLIILVNIFINFRETNSFILIQNYGGIPLYQANNPNTKSSPYNSSEMESFADEYFFKIYNDNTLSTSEKSDILSARAKKYILSNFNKFIKTTVSKFKSLFITNYNLDFYIWFVGSIVLYFITKRKEIIFFFFANLILMLLTSIGLNIYRYSVFIAVSYTFTKVSVFYYIYRKIYLKINNLRLI